MKKYIYIVTFLLLIGIVSALDSNLSNPSNTTYTTSINIPIAFQRTEDTTYCAYGINDTWQEFNCNVTKDYRFDVSGDGMFRFRLNTSDGATSITHEREISINRDITTSKGLIVMAILFVTQFFAFLFCYISFNMDSSHEFLRVFFLVLALLLVLSDFGLINIALREYVKNEGLQAMNDNFFFIINWMLYVFIFVIALQLVFNVIKALQNSANRKKYGEDYEQNNFYR